ncbi:MAG: hypothetical protein QOG68_2351 [Solirubrobacteraceae bacterium]|nr:hypothetical protein [Solirubrobacteraceae bacterium]
MTLAELETAIRAAWDRDTSDDPDEWTPEWPTRGQCAVTAHVVRELFGGEILVARVTPSINEHHLWNRLPSGVELDLTLEQFRDGQLVGDPWIGEPTPDTLPRCELLSSRVRERLGLVSV